MNYKIGQKVWYQDGISISSGYYTIDSEEQIDYGYGSTDEYYYFKELQNSDESRLGRFRVWKDRIIPLDKLIVCKDCGSVDIKSPIWYNPNTKELLNNNILDIIGSYCNNCNKAVELITRKEFEDKLVILEITKNNE